MDELNNFGEVTNNASLERYNTYGIKTSCKYLVKPNNVDNLISLVNFLNNSEIKYYVIGKGSNVILPDTLFNGVIISLELLNSVEFNGNIVTVDAGISLSSFVQKCINNNLGGLEYLATIPGTVGGALVGNAGVKDHETYDNVLSVEVIRNKKLVKLDRKDINVSYRHTEFKNTSDIIVRATFKLSEGNAEEMNSIVKESRQKRLSSQPLEYKNAGSVFKNPEGNYAGKLIESVGLKGYSIGDASISEKHANFIINKGNATSKDIKDLIKVVQDKVYKEYNIKLELEQIVIDWD